ncbi:MAG: carboxypeptidase regulatory-like domain-containing protein [Candidatus Eremiobacteraeota bacterium]|nr:carboxypeptidase regulatory-like domain-containing protein [Candidatus Eremiobacteraeota bacterium]
MQVAILLALSNFFFWAMPVDWQRSQQDVVVSGSVVDEGTGAPIAGAVVHAMSDANVAQTTSDSQGRFVFLTLLPGAYSLCASSHGYTLDCHPRDSNPMELLAGFEYGATVVLAPATN